MNYYHKLVNKPLCLRTRARESLGKEDWYACTDATGGFPAKWRLSRETSAEIPYWWLMTCHYPDLSTASDWMKQNFKPIRSTTQIRVSLKYLRSFLRSHFARKTPVASRNIYRLFSQTKKNPFCVDIAWKEGRKAEPFFPLPLPPKLKEPETKARDQQVSIPNFPYSLGRKECLQIERFYL